MPIVYSLETNQYIVKLDKITARHASYNKINQMTLITDTNGKVYLTDKNFAITHAMQTECAYYGSIKWLDEFRFLLDGFSMQLIGDIRMPTDNVEENASSEKKQIQISKRKYSTVLTVPSTGPYTLQFSTNYRLACTWNLRDYTWSNVFALPDEVVGTPLCNSRYAAFTCTDNAIWLLDFDN